MGREAELLLPPENASGLLSPMKTWNSGGLSAKRRMALPLLDPRRTPHATALILPIPGPTHTDAARPRDPVTTPATDHGSDGRSGGLKAKLAIYGGATGILWGNWKTFLGSYFVLIVISLSRLSP